MIWTRLRSLIVTLLRRRRFEDDMADELGFHIEAYAADLVRTGVPTELAVRQARLEFGSLDNAKSDCRQAFGLRVFDDLQQYVRYAFRLMRKAPGFTTTALAALALCLGAALTIFAVVDAVLLRPLPFPEADRLVRVFNTYPKAGVMDDGASLTNYYERRGAIASFTSIAIYREGTAIVGDTAATERRSIARVSPDFFATLGIGPVIGRAFTDDETSPQTDRVAILTDAYWRQHLNGDPHVLGHRIRMDGSDRTVVGILPQNFSFLSSTALIYVPLSSAPPDRAPAQRHSGSSSQMVARLAPAATLSDAQAQIDQHNARVEAGSAQAMMMADAGFRSLVVPLRSDHVAAIRPTLLLLQTGVLLLLAIGAVNVANLLLVRAAGRAQELAVRQAIGASRHHIVGEVMVETLLLTVTGGLLALAVAAGGIRVLNLLGASQLPLGAHIAFDMRSAAVAVGASIAIGVLIAVPICWYHLRHRSLPGLHLESRGSTSSLAAQRVRHVFVVAQITLAFVLLAGAALLGLSVRNALAVAPGFRPDNVLSGAILLSEANYRTAASRLAFTDALTARLAEQPGIVAAGVVTNVPFSGITIKSAATVEGRARSAGESPRGHYSYGITGDAFAALGVPLVAGRFLDGNDSRRDARVVVVDEDFARTYWPQGDAIGQRLFQGSAQGADADAFTIVGVVGAIKQAGLTDGETQGAVYYPYSTRLDAEVFVLVRTSVPPESMAATLRDVVRRVDPELPVTDVRTMQARIADSMIARRSPALLAGAFSALALLLTTIGTYGVLTYAVAQRRSEIGLRIALGARPEQIRAQFLSLAVRLVASGTSIGAVGAFLTGRAMEAVLFHVPALHVPTFAGTAAVLAAVCLAGCLLPSQRAARISATQSLVDH